MEITPCTACGEDIGFDPIVGYVQRDYFGAGYDHWIPDEVGEFVNESGLSVLAHAQCGIDNDWKMA